MLPARQQSAVYSIVNEHLRTTLGAKRCLFAKVSFHLQQLQALVIFGGTFDPPHIGHMRLALELHALQPRWSIVFMPCAQNACKTKTQTSPAHRLNLVRLLLQAHPQFSIFDDELRAGGVSSTVLSLETLRRHYGSELPILLLMGVDSYNSLAQWHRVQELPRLCSLLVANRPGYSRTTPSAAASSWRTVALSEAASASSGYLCWLQLPEIAISSSAVRVQLTQRLDASAWLPPALQAYIKEQGLYGQ